MRWKNTFQLGEAFRLDQIVLPIALGLLYIAVLFPYDVQGNDCLPELQCLECNVTAENTQYCTKCYFGSGLLIDRPNAIRCRRCGYHCMSCSIIGDVCEQCISIYGPVLDGLGKGNCGPMGTTQSLTTAPTGGRLTTAASMASPMTVSGVTFSRITGDGSGTGSTVTNAGVNGSTSSQDLFGTTTLGDGLNYGSNGSAIPGSSSNTSFPDESNSLGAYEIDWRILLTLLLLIHGGIFITFVSVLCWANRFNSPPDADV